MGVSHLKSRGVGGGPPLWSAIAAIATVIALGACAVVGGSLSRAPEEVGEGLVGLDVWSDPTGNTLLLLPVSFGDSGPYQFLLDTGASRTVLDLALAEKLGLTRGGEAQGTGVISQFRGTQVEVETWRVGEIELQPRTLIAADLPQSPPQGPQFRGLLGSDVLAGFGVVEINYDEQTLTLRSSQ
jgi:predicted aspartyl protease